VEERPFQGRVRRSKALALAMVAVGHVQGRMKPKNTDTVKAFSQNPLSLGSGGHNLDAVHNPRHPAFNELHSFFQ
jgi:hypothetical protein